MDGIQGKNATETERVMSHIFIHPVMTVMHVLLILVRPVLALIPLQLMAQPAVRVQPPVQEPIPAVQAPASPTIMPTLPTAAFVLSVTVQAHAMSMIQHKTLTAASVRNVRLWVLAATRLPAKI